MNRYSEKLLSLDHPSVSHTEDLLFGCFLENEVYFNLAYQDLDQDGGFPEDILDTYICLLAAMNDEDIQEFKRSFLENHESHTALPERGS